MIWQGGGGGGGETRAEVGEKGSERVAEGGRWGRRVIPEGKGGPHIVMPGYSSSRPTAPAALDCYCIAPTPPPTPHHPCISCARQQVASNSITSFYPPALLIQVSRAVSVFRTMLERQIAPNSITCHALFNGCLRHGDVLLAREVSHTCMRGEGGEAGGQRDDIRGV
jgi:hypothetical protein